MKDSFVVSWTVLESFHRSVEALDKILLCNISSIPCSVANQCKRFLKLKLCKLYYSLCMFAIIKRVSNELLLICIRNKE